MCVCFVLHTEQTLVLMHMCVKTKVCTSAQICEKLAVGDTVNVFQGTGAYVRGNKTVAFIGTVVGYDANEGKWLILLVLLPRLSCLVMSCDVYCSPMCRSVISWRQNVDFRTRWKNNTCQG